MKVKAGRWLQFSKKERYIIIMVHVARQIARRATKEEYYEYHESRKSLLEGLH